MHNHDQRSSGNQYGSYRSGGPERRRSAPRDDSPSNYYAHEDLMRRLSPARHVLLRDGAGGTSIPNNISNFVHIRVGAGAKEAKQYTRRTVVRRAAGGKEYIWRTEYRRRGLGWKSCWCHFVVRVFAGDDMGNRSRSWKGTSKGYGGGSSLL